MFCSTIIATIARPTLARAVTSVLEQELPNAGHEVIVVNDSGSDLPQESWQLDDRVRIIQTSRQEKSVARNTGAWIALGDYLHFLDDDDFLVPGALERFWQLAQSSEADFLYGSAILTDRSGKYLLQLQQKLVGNCFIQLMAGEWIPLGAYLVRAKTFTLVGGFNPAMTVGEDSDLVRRVGLLVDFAGMDAAVLQAAVGFTDTSVDYTQLAAQSRKAREVILDTPGAVARMRSSANTNFWKGRIVRAYLTSVIWNLQHQRFDVAVSRFLTAFLGLFQAGFAIFSAEFWLAIRKGYQSPSFDRERNR